MKLKYIALLLFFSVQLFGQKITPAKWSWTLSPAQPAVGQEAEVIFKVSIDKGWYLYSSDFDKELGPVVTTVSIKPGLGIEAIGPLKAINPHSKEDKEIWGGTYTYFTDQAEFRQKLKLLQRIGSLMGLMILKPVPTKAVYASRLKVILRFQPARTQKKSL